VVNDLNRRLLPIIKCLSGKMLSSGNEWNRFLFSEVLELFRSVAAC
jgi:hypothetical protein